jgi:hypothetical protein
MTQAHLHADLLSMVIRPHWRPPTRSPDLAIRHDLIRS